MIHYSTCYSQALYFTLFGKIHYQNLQIFSFLEMFQISADKETSENTALLLQFGYTSRFRHLHCNAWLVGKKLQYETISVFDSTIGILFNNK